MPRGLMAQRQYYKRKGMKTFPRNKAAVKRIVQKEIKNAAEKKYHDKNLQPAVSFFGSVTNLSEIPVGTNDVGRIGDKCTPTNLSIRFFINGETITGLVRCIVFRWNQFTVPGVDNILQTTGSVYGPTSPYVHDTLSERTILHDQVYTVSNNGGSELRYVHVAKKLAKKPIEFTLGGTTSAKHQIYVLFISESALISSPTIAMYSRLNFIDL